MTRQQTSKLVMVSLLACAGFLLPACEDDADTNALQGGGRRVEAKNMHLSKDNQSMADPLENGEKQMVECPSDKPEYGVSTPKDFEIDNLLWNKTKARLSVLGRDEKKCLFLHALVKCNESLKLLEEDRLKIASVQSILLADLASEVAWPEMAQNCHAEANVYTAVVRGEAAEEGPRKRILSDLGKLTDDRLRMVEQEVNESELDSAYRDHKELFDRTAIDVCNMAKIMVWGRGMGRK